MRLDLGCGHTCESGHIGVDIAVNANIAVVADLTRRWPFDDNSVDGAMSSHLIEHFDAGERVHFINELYRVMRSGAEAVIVTPHWCSQRAYGDLTHKWPPVSEYWFYYLSAEWRTVHADADSTGMYKCDFKVRWLYGVNDERFTRLSRSTLHALKYYKDAAEDIRATLVARK